MFTLSKKFKIFVAILTDWVNFTDDEPCLYVNYSIHYPKGWVLLKSSCELKKTSICIIPQDYYFCPFGWIYSPKNSKCYKVSAF